MASRAALGEISSDLDRVGFFGKLPTHGDFVASGLSPQFQARLDAWLQAGMQAAEAGVETAWELLFRSMSPWRFVLERGIWGEATVTGVIAPSIDRVGRSFPLVIAAQMRDFKDDPQRFYFDHTWFTAVEGIAETAAKRDFDIGRFTESLRRLRSPIPVRPDDGDDLRRNLGRSALWWRIDAADRQPKGFRTTGSPAAEDFARLVREGATAPMDARQSTRQIAVSQHSGSTSSQTTSLLLHSCGATHPGTRLSINADVLLMRQHPDIVAVADGIGTTGAAAEAARQVLQSLGNIPVHDSIELLAQDVKGKLGHAHGLLQSASQNADALPRTASLAALFRHGDDLAVLWVGDARCYILRHGTMRCLTRDHIALGLRRSLARAVGMAGPLKPDMVTDILQPGDRFLLCSAPLARIVPERAIAGIVSSAGIDEAPEILVQEALISGCRENISALVVDVVANGD